MANLRPFFRLTLLQAARFVELTAGQINRIEPIQGRNPGGTQWWYVAERNRDNPAFAYLALFFAALPEPVGIDVDVVFPQPPEGEERKPAEVKMLAEAGALPAAKA